MMDNKKQSDFTLTAYPTQQTSTFVNTKKLTANSSSLNTGVIIGISIAAFVALIILIYAIYKYRNRDEGTYTIDETKNFGPFADLDANSSANSNSKNNSLNCASKKSKSTKKMRQVNGNKEWYV